MKGLLMIIILLSIFFEVHSDEQYHLNQVELSVLKDKETLWEKLNNDLLSYIQSRNEYITTIDNNQYIKVYELIRNRFEKVYALIYRISEIIPEYYLIVVIYDESNQVTRVVNILDVKRERKYEMIDLPSFFEDSNVPILGD